jgi:hypothetical protein
MASKINIIESADRLMSFASKQDSTEVAASVRKITTLPNDATEFIVGRFIAESTRVSEHPKLVQGRGFLQAGYRDVSGLLLPCFRHLSFEDSKALIADSRTSHTLAVLALRSTHELGTAIQNNYTTGVVGIHSDGYLAITEPNHPILKTHDGRYCPYAGEPGFPKPTPVFNAFARHAAEVTLLTEIRDKKRIARKVGEKVLPFYFNDPYYGVHGLYRY